jgi:hypothetical protein
LGVAGDAGVVYARAPSVSAALGVVAGGCSSRCVLASPPEDRVGEVGGGPPRCHRLDERGLEVGGSRVGLVGGQVPPADVGTLVVTDVEPVLAVA